jgi:DNA primase
VLELFVAANVDLRIMTPPDEFDPCEFLLERSADEWRGLLDKATDPLHHKIELSLKGVNRETETQKVHNALTEVLTTIARAPLLRTGSTSSDDLRARSILTTVGKKFFLDDDTIRKKVNEIQNLQSKSSRPSAVATSDPEKRVRCCDLPPAECELLEMLVLHPECAATALQEIAAEDISHEVARSIFLLYRRQEEEGADLDFGRVLAEIETPSLKSLLVQIDDQAAAKEEKAILEPAARMRHLIAHFRKRHIEIELRKTEAALESKLPVQEEDDLLAQLIARKRQQQGILATDA